MAASITPIWERIHNWLGKNAEKTLESLNGGATVEQIQELERKCDVGLPEDFKASYCIHNGASSGPFFDSLTFMTLDEILVEWEMLKKIQDDNDSKNEDDNNGNEPQAPSKYQDKWWHPKWIPFANDGSGNNLVIDMAPGDEGTLGQVFFWFHDAAQFEHLGSNFTQFLNNFARDLEEEKYAVDENTNYLYLKERGF